MTLRAVIADDEPLGIEMIKALLEELDGSVEVVATCANGDETLVRVAETRPDLLFLDINMPRLDGIAVAKWCSQQDPPRPLIVFTTAHAQFGAQAFDLEAADYLLKPVKVARLARALERVNHLRDNAVRGKTIPVPTLGGIELLDLEAVEWVEAARDYIGVFCSGRSFVIRRTLATFASWAYPELRQCHRCYLVNIRLVRRVIPKPRGEAVLCLPSGGEVPVSRGYKSILRDLGVIGE